MEPGYVLVSTTADAVRKALEPPQHILHGKEDLVFKKLLQEDHATGGLYLCPDKLRKWMQSLINKALEGIVLPDNIHEVRCSKHSLVAGL